MRIGRGFDLGGFRHHLFVERGAAGGVEQHHVVAAELGGFQRAPGDLRRLLAGDDRQGLDIEIAPEHRELLHRRRAIDVERGHQHLALVALGQAAGELGGRGGFAGALQADHHDRDRRHGVEVDGLAVGTEGGDQFVVDDLHHHLAGRHRLDHGGADRLLANFFGKTSDHVERDVGLQQRAAHLAHRGIDVGLGQRPAPGQPIENATKFFRQIVEHFSCPSCCPHPEEQASACVSKGGDALPLDPLLRDAASRLAQDEGYSKHFCARGRIALSGVDLRPLGPGGGSKRTSFRGLRALNPRRPQKSRKVAGKWHFREPRRPAHPLPRHIF